MCEVYRMDKKSQHYKSMQYRITDKPVLCGIAELKAELLAKKAEGNDWNCTIFWNNGANGHSNFTLRVGQIATYYVRYNDTAACVAGLNGGSEGASRYFIWVP